MELQTALWRSSPTTDPSMNRCICFIDHSKFASRLSWLKISRLFVMRIGQPLIRCSGVSGAPLQSLQVTGRPAWGLILPFWCLRRKQWPVKNWTNLPMVFLSHLPISGAILFVLILLKKTLVCQQWSCSFHSFCHTLSMACLVSLVIARP
jgi:hypothetical protein